VFEPYSGPVFGPYSELVFGPYFGPVHVWTIWIVPLDSYTYVVGKPYFGLVPV
ncbi:hypothetical protein LINPERHAP2_LOCUS28628, partial [Linum perenne]